MGSAKSKIAIFGGSFDPPHSGHAMIVAWLLWTKQADQVWLVPAYKHAFGKKSSPFDDRVLWCQALATLFPVGQVLVSTIEETLPSPSYTLHTLDTLQKNNPDYQFRLVVGADVLKETSRWFHWDEIVARFNPLYVSRAGYEPIPGSPVWPDISSTRIRTLLATEGKTAVTHLVPDVVLQLFPEDPAFWKR